MKIDYNNLVPGSVDVFALSAALPLPAYAPPGAEQWPVLPPSSAEETDVWTPLEPGVVFPPQVGADALEAADSASPQPAWGLDGLMTDARLAATGTSGPGADGLAADLAAFGLASFDVPQVGRDDVAPPPGPDAEPLYATSELPIETDTAELDPSSDAAVGLEVFSGAFDDGAGDIDLEDPAVVDWAGDNQLLDRDAFEHPDFVAAD